MPRIRFVCVFVTILFFHCFVAAFAILVPHSFSDMAFHVDGHNTLIYFALSACWCTKLYEIQKCENNTG